VALPLEYSLPFAACYTYSLKGDSEVSQRSRQLCARVKSGSAQWLKSYAASVHHEVTRKRRFCGLFCEHTLLAPVPNNTRPGARRFGWPGVSHLLCRRRAWQNVCGPAYEESAPWIDRRQPGCGSGRPCNNTISPSP
jgi:hypothetical protein